MNKYRFWFDDEHYGVSSGETIMQAFKFFRDHGFVETDVISVEKEKSDAV